MAFNFFFGVLKLNFPLNTFLNSVFYYLFVNGLNNQVHTRTFQLQRLQTTWILSQKASSDDAMEIRAMLVFVHKKKSPEVRICILTNCLLMPIQDLYFNFVTLLQKRNNFKFLVQ